MKANDRASYFTRAASKTVAIGLAIGLTSVGCDSSDEEPSQDAGPGADDAGAGGGADSLEEALERMGVDTTFEPRVDADEEPLDDRYAPLGPTSELETRVRELAIVGTALEGQSEHQLTVLDADTTTDASGLVELEGGDPIHQAGDSDHPWATADGGSNEPQSRRDVDAFDVDGDGKEELIAVYMEGPDVMLEVLDDADAGFEVLADETLTERTDIVDVAIAAGDFSEDGDVEIVIALSDDAQTELLHVYRDGDAFRVTDDWSETLQPQNEGHPFHVVLDAGGLDRDHADELVVVLNEEDPEFAERTGLAHYWVFDDFNSEFELLDSGQVTGTDRDGNAHSVDVADAAIADVTGDGRAELTLGGLVGMEGDCLEGTDHYEKLFFMTRRWDGASFEELDAHAVFNDDNTIGCNNSGFQFENRFAPVGHLNATADEHHELQVGRFLFAWSAEEEGDAPRWVEFAELNEDDYYGADPGGGGVFSRATADFAVGDFSGDGHDNLMFYSTSSDQVSIWGMHLVEGDSSFYTVAIDMEFYGSSDFRHPRLVPLDVFGEATVLRYEPESHEFVFTEPVVLAALAAAPCWDDAAQNSDACVTRYGLGESEEEGRESTVSFSAGVHAGVNIEADIPFVPEFSTEIVGSVERTESHTLAEAYRLERSVVYETGPLEDTVIFTTIPYDLYTYEIVSHPDEELEGGEMIVSLPREPRRLMVEREFFNEIMAEHSVHIGDDVFAHSPGDPLSYPTVTDRNDLLSGAGSDLIGDSEWVPEGTGLVEVELVLAEIEEHQESLETSYSMEVSTTAGAVIAGFSVGHGTEETLTVTTEESTIYGASVGAIEGDAWEELRYAFGLFMYPIGTGPQSFQVVNYWVETD